jgi:hypothetical protein
LPCAPQQQFACQAARDFLFGGLGEPSGFLRKALLKDHLSLIAISTLSHGGPPTKLPRQFKSLFLPLSARFPAETANNCFRVPLMIGFRGALYFIVRRNVPLAPVKSNQCVRRFGSDADARRICPSPFPKQSMIANRSPVILCDLQTQYQRLNF